MTPREDYLHAIHAGLQDPEEHKRRKTASKKNPVGARAMEQARENLP